MGSCVGELSRTRALPCLTARADIPPSPSPPVKIALILSLITRLYDPYTILVWFESFSASSGFSFPVAFRSARTNHPKLPGSNHFNINHFSINLQTLLTKSISRKKYRNHACFQEDEGLCFSFSFVCLGGARGAWWGGSIRAV